MLRNKIVPFRVILSSGLTAATVINNKMPSLKCDKVVFIMQLIVWNSKWHCLYYVLTFFSVVFAILHCWLLYYETEGWSVGTFEIKTREFYCSPIPLTSMSLNSKSYSRPQCPTNQALNGNLEFTLRFVNFLNIFNVKNALKKSNFF